jgi:hypothetical protein
MDDALPAQPNLSTERLELVKRDDRFEVKLPAPIESLDAAFEVIAALGWIH